MGEKKLEKRNEERLIRHNVNGNANNMTQEEKEKKELDKVCANNTFCILCGALNIRLLCTKSKLFGIACNSFLTNLLIKLK